MGVGIKLDHDASTPATFATHAYWFDPGLSDVRLITKHAAMIACGVTSARFEILVRVGRDTGALRVIFDAHPVLVPLVALFLCRRADETVLLGDVAECAQDVLEAVDLASLETAAVLGTPFQLWCAFPPQATLPVTLEHRGRRRDRSRVRAIRRARAHKHQHQRSHTTTVHVRGSFAPARVRGSLAAASEE